MLVLKMQVYDTFMICGDFNARCSNKPDIDRILYTTDIPSRHSVDCVPSNVYGTSLIDFMIECDLCMLNGRFGENSNKFTCISARGASVVDYTLVPIRNFHSFTDFSVHYMTDLIIDLKIPTDGKISDHSLLKWCYKWTSLTTFKPHNTSTNNSPKTSTSLRLPRVQIPDNYLTNSSRLQSFKS